MPYGLLMLLSNYKIVGEGMVGEVQKGIKKIIANIQTA